MLRMDITLPCKMLSVILSFKSQKLKLLAYKKLLSRDGMWNSCDAQVLSFLLLSDVVETYVGLLKIQISYKLFDMKQQMFKLFFELMHY